VVVVEVNGYEVEPGANLEGANLEEADLKGANLTGANLTGANLIGANPTGIVADENTTWPDGFDPGAAGVFFRD